MNILVNANERLLRSNLEKWGHTVVTVKSASEAFELLKRSNSPNLAILQAHSNSFNGMAVCRKLREAAVEPYKYIVLLMAKAAKDVLLEAFELGADDYIVKPLDGYELRAKLLGARRILELQDRLLAMRDELTTQATHDALTGVWNRRAMMDTLASELERSGREQASVGVDIDHFKSVNDTYGHQAGDEVLRKVANVLKSSVRAYDVVGRIGGEEFLIVLPGCQHGAIGDRMESFRAALAAQPVETSEESIRLTVSIGAVTTSTRMSATKLIKAADEALYRAKNAGRNRVEVAERFTNEPAFAPEI